MPKLISAHCIYIPRNIFFFKEKKNRDKQNIYPSVTMYAKHQNVIWRYLDAAERYMALLGRGTTLYDVTGMRQDVIWCYRETGK